MKKYFEISISLFLSLILFSSCYRNDLAPVELIKDCTGSYIRIADEDYKICNYEKFESYENGTRILISYEILDTCENPNIPPSICNLFHDYEAWIHVEEVE